MLVLDVDIEQQVHMRHPVSQFPQITNLVARAVPARIVLDMGKPAAKTVAPQVPSGLKVYLVLHRMAVRVQIRRIESLRQQVGPGAKHDVRHQVVMGDRVAMTGMIGRPSPARLVSRLIEVVASSAEHVRPRQVRNAGNVTNPFRRTHMLLRPRTQLRVDRMPHRDLDDPERVL